MRVLRTIISALMIMLGSLAITVWAASLLVLHLIEDGTLVTNVVTRAYDVSMFEVDVTDETQVDVHTYFEGQDVDLDDPRLRDEIDEIIRSAMQPEAFTDLIAAQVIGAWEQFLSQLRDPDRAPGPLTIVVDVSDIINEQFDSSPDLSQELPRVELEPITVEAVDAETFEEARSTYRLLDFARTWMLWIGLALVAIGFAVSPRRRWFLSKLFLTIGTLALVAWALMTLTAPATVATWTQVGQGGAVGTVIEEVMASDTYIQFAQTVQWVAIGALVAAAIAAALAWGMARRAGRELPDQADPSVGRIEAVTTDPTEQVFLPGQAPQRADDYWNR